MKRGQTPFDNGAATFFEKCCWGLGVRVAGITKYGCRILIVSYKK